MSAGGLFVPRADLEELTGYKRNAEMVDWLKRHGWRHEVNSAGEPKVAMAYFERRMVGEVKAADPPPAARHNFKALSVVK